MKSERQIAANRANARRSSGPRAGAGKQRSSQNARTHGLTTPPPPDVVVRLFRTLMEAAAESPTPEEKSPLERAAWALAAAEAQVQRIAEMQFAILDALHCIETERLPAREGASYRTLIRMKPVIHLSFPNDRKFAMQMIATFHRERDALHEALRLLDRYRRETDARRHKAFRHWIDVSACDTSGNASSARR